MDILIWINTLGILGVVIANAIYGYRVLKEIAEIARETHRTTSDTHRMTVEVLTRLADAKLAS